MKLIVKISCMLIAGFSIVQSAYAQWDDMKPIAGAKMFFSDKPFSTGNAGNKSSFTSKDFIYCRLELLPTQTLYNAFDMQRMKNRYYLRYRVSAFKDGEQKGTFNLWDYLLIKNQNEKNNWLNFDIMPEPANAISVICGSEIFNTGLAAGPLYHIISRENFPENGKYIIKVRLFLEAYDAWGSKDELNKWPVADGEFAFDFNAQDVQTIRKNATAANEVIANNAFLIKKLPDYFNRSATVNDAELTNAKIAAILKRDLSDRVVIKFSLAQYTGPLWQVEADASGVIKYKYAAPDIHIAYKWNGKCYVGTARLWKDYEGGDKYGSLKVGWSTCNSCGDLIDCALVK